MQIKYTRGKPVDKERLAQYLEAAKGPNRTMKQFAEECNVNPSTLSRIANKKLVGGSSEALMVAIFEHADPASGVALENLMDANGMVPAGSIRPHNFGFQERTVSEILISEMNRRVQATVTVPLRRQFRLSRTMGYTPDIVFESDTFGGNGLWAIDVVPMVHFMARRDDDTSEEMVRRRAQMMNRRRFFDRLSRYATIGYFREEELPQRFSYVLLDADTFKDIIAEYGEQKFKGDVSLIFVDLNNLKIVDEFIFPRQNGDTMEKFFTVPVDGKITEDDDWLINIDDIKLGGDI